MPIIPTSLLAAENRMAEALARFTGGVMTPELRQATDDIRRAVARFVVSLPPAPPPPES